MSVKPPKFEPGQLVHFIGGSGEVKSCHLTGNTCWSYVVEMDMGETPPMGRVGGETVILLEESDLLPSGRIQKSRSGLRLRARRRTSAIR